jgi:hypothetical protein
MNRGPRSPWSSQAVQLGRFAWTAMVLASSSTVACTAINDTSQTQCDEDSDCRSRFAERARCVDEFCVPGPPPVGCFDSEPPPPRVEAATFLLEVWHASRATPLADVQLRMCSEDDHECSTPLQVVVTDTNGIAWLTAPPGTDGGDLFFVEATLEGYVPSIYYVARPWIEASAAMFVRIPLDMIRPVELSTYLEFGGIAYDPTLGLVVMSATDCEGLGLPGARFTADPLGAAVPFHFHTLPVAVTSPTEVTDASGRGGFANVSPGLVRVRAVHADGDRLAGERVVLVRPGWWTDVRLSPAAGEVYDPRLFRMRWE